MIEIILGVTNIFVAILFYYFGTIIGKKQNKEVINTLKDQKGNFTRKINQLKNQNTELKSKIDQSNNQNKELIGKVENLKNQYDEQTQMLEKSYQAIGDLKEELKEYKSKKPDVNVISKKESEINKAIKELAIYGFKKWGKNTIDDLLNPDDE